MPVRNGTGPMGTGAMTGRSLGFCSGVGNLTKGTGPGMACRCGFDRGLRKFSANEQMTADNRKAPPCGH